VKLHALVAATLTCNELNMISTLVSFVEYYRIGWFRGQLALLISGAMYVVGLYYALCGSQSLTSAHKQILVAADALLDELESRNKHAKEVIFEMREKRIDQAVEKEERYEQGLFWGGGGTIKRGAEEVGGLKRVAHQAKNLRSQYAFLLERGGRSTKIKKAINVAEGLLSQAAHEEGAAGAGGVGPTAAPVQTSDDFDASEVHLSAVAADAANEEAEAARRNRVKLSHVLPVVRLAFYSVPSACEPLDFTGLLSVNALQAYSFAMANLVLALLYLNYQPDGATTIASCRATWQQVKLEQRLSSVSTDEAWSDARSSLYKTVDATPQGACIRRTFVQASTFLSGVALVTALITMLFDLQHQIASLDEARERQQRFHEQVGLPSPLSPGPLLPTALAPLPPALGPPLFSSGPRSHQPWAPPTSPGPCCTGLGPPLLFRSRRTRS